MNSVTLHWPQFVRFSIHNKRKVQFMRRSNDVEYNIEFTSHNIIVSHTNDMTAPQSDILFWYTPVAGNKYLSF